MANKLLKYQYLFPGNVQGGDHLKSVLEKSIHDFNEVRPHGKLGGLTPSEVYSGKNVSVVFDTEALRTRIDESRGNTGCTLCENE